jgi:hypothetical protein
MAEQFEAELAERAALLEFVAVAAPLLRLMASRWEEAKLPAEERIRLRRAADRADALLKRAQPASARKRPRRKPRTWREVMAAPDYIEDQLGGVLALPRLPPVGPHHRPPPDSIEASPRIVQARRHHLVRML